MLHQDQPIRIALTGANGAYARTLLAQARHLPRLQLTTALDPDLTGTRTLLTQLGYNPDAIDISDGTHPVNWANADVLVEASGVVGAGYRYAHEALWHNTHVVMVSKEVESVAGVDLYHTAHQAGLSYLPGEGDQPANLIKMLTWARGLGLEIVAAGKSSEYDLIYHPDTAVLTHQEERSTAPELSHLLEMKDSTKSVLAARAEALAALNRQAAADLCEMDVVAHYTSLRVDHEQLHYPIARPAELADIYQLKSTGGILKTPGSLDVFSMLRLSGEASFAGGVFLVIQTSDAPTWELLRSKGHVVSADASHAALYWPYHAMGIETPASIFAAVERAAHPAPRQSTVLAARASEPLRAGTSFQVRGHHHEIDGLSPRLFNTEDVDENAIPFYLLGGATLTRDLQPGQLLRWADVTGIDEAVAGAYRRGLAATITADPTGEQTSNAERTPQTTRASEPR